MKYSKRIVLIIITLNIIFTGAILYLVYVGTEIPDELISRWFLFTGVELGSLAGIKITDTVSDTLKEKYDQLAKGDMPNKSDIEDE